MAGIGVEVTHYVVEAGRSGSGSGVGSGFGTGSIVSVKFGFGIGSRSDNIINIWEQDKFALGLAMSLSVPACLSDTFPFPVDRRKDLYICPFVTIGRQSNYQASDRQTDIKTYEHTDKNIQVKLNGIPGGKCMDV